jgi:hypothetical protein
MTAVPPEKVGTKFTEPLYGGVDVLGTRFAAIGVELRTVRVAATLVVLPTEFDTVTV